MSEWRESAKIPPPKNNNWIFGCWSDTNIYAIHIVRWRESLGMFRWCRRDQTAMVNDPVMWMPIPPLNPKEDAPDAK